MQVEWLNSFLRQAWPSLNVAASKAASDSIDVMLKQYQPDAIEVMRVKSLDLGEVPPVFKGGAPVRFPPAFQRSNVLLEQGQ